MDKQDNHIDEIEVEIEGEGEVLEFALNETEINELIKKLQELKQTKSSFNFDINEENELIIHHADKVGEDDE